MELVFIGLLIFSILLLVASFFVQDSYKSIREEFDLLQIQQIQEIYQIKKKLKILEEELLVSDSDFEKASPVNGTKNHKEVHAIIKNQVWSLAQQGLSVEQIAKQSSLNVDEVTSILNEFAIRGDKL